MKSGLIRCFRHQANMYNILRTYLPISMWILIIWHVKTDSSNSFHSSVLIQRKRTYIQSIDRTFLSTSNCLSSKVNPHSDKTRLRIYTVYVVGTIFTAQLFMVFDSTTILPTFIVQDNLINIMLSLNTWFFMEKNILHLKIPYKGIFFS